MMIRLLVDENFNNDAIYGLREKNPYLDVVRVQDVGLSGATDAEILEWAAQERRVLLSHDVATVPAEAWRRVADGRAMAGAVVVRQQVSVGQLVRALEVLVTCTDAEELDGKVMHLPL